MKFIIKNKFNILNLMRRLGYHPIKNGESYSKRIQNREFPRFHVYLKTKKDSLEFSIHLDQKSTCYEGHTAHSGDYNGSLLEEEKNRINNQVKNI
tara:strand:+ start:78 stop:362 length:285 start_codon:yes stop_codon:yes gene_type:complete